VEIFNTDPDIRVIGIAADGEEAVNAAMTMKPDVITMDINMPGMDGFEATRAIMSACPTPIVIVTGKMDPKDSATLFRVMEAGALMITAKPFPPGHPEHGESVRELIKTVKLMSEIKVVRRSFPREKRQTLPVTSFQQIVPTETAARIRMVAIGASTGGPPLLQSILSSLPSDFKAPVAIVQHMSKGFTGEFVNWLNQSSRLPVELAVDGRHMSPGRVYVAPDGYQMQVAPGDRICLSEDPPENGQRPSVSALFRSVARVYGRCAVGVLLTGMGKDGAQELKEIRNREGITIAQNRESSVVFGMPGEAVRIDAAEYILSPEEIILMLLKLVHGPQTLRTSTRETGKYDESAQ
jgi:two-component system chemotaxis response regulator CheB